MSNGIKVFYLNDFNNDEPISGSTDGVLKDKEYLQIKKQDGTSSLIHHAFVWHDTVSNRELLTKHQEAYKAWKKAEPNMYNALNKMLRIK